MGEAKRRKALGYDRSHMARQEMERQRLEAERRAKQPPERPSTRSESARAAMLLPLLMATLAPPIALSWRGD